MAAGKQEGQPAVFVSHGSPMTALDNGAYAQALAAFGSSVSPAAILVISAHWEEPEIRIGAAAHPELIYDFGGFPRELYQLRYPAPGSPVLANEVAARLRSAGFEATLDPARGWDHGVWVPLRLMFPDAKIPVVEIALPVNWQPQELYRVGAALQMFRRRDVLVLGSGGIVHNLRLLNWHERGAPPDTWATEFQNWVTSAMTQHDLASLFAYESRAPYASRAVPTPEHFAPLFPVLGAAGEYSRVVPVYEAIEHGNMSMYSFQLMS